MQDKIVIKGAREHNLRNIDVEIPRNKLVVITGLSGSGKSSLAFDTIYAEGQRRYVESLSTYARQFLELMEKPDVDSIDGLSPAISIDQKSASRNPRSTVGTITEIYDYLRLLYAKIGQPHCPLCGKPVSKQSAEQIVDKIAVFPADEKILLLAPVVKDRKGEHTKVLDRIQKSGFVRMRIDGQIYNISDEIKLDKNKNHTIEVVVDRLVTKKEWGKEGISRLTDSTETALGIGEGTMIVAKQDKEEDILFSELFACVDCDVNLPEITPRSFSFNSPHGACPECHGLGTKLEIDTELVMPNPRLTLEEGAVMPWSKTSSRLTWYNLILKKVAEKHNFKLNEPVGKLSEKHRQTVLYGTGEETYVIESPGEKGHVYKVKFEGVIPNLERRYQETDSEYVRQEIEKFMQVKECPSCKGKRLKPEILAVTIGERSIIDLTEMSIKYCIKFFEKLKLSKTQASIAKLILKEIESRLNFLSDVGLNYLTLDRSAATLSGGEAQRIRLATQIGSHLQGVLYVLDEPSIGLHQRDNRRLINTLENLRNLGNTVIVVEHDEETINAADYLLDIGPGAGKHGGKVVSQGTPAEVKKDEKSLTGKYLAGTKSISVPKKRHKGNGKTLKIIAAAEHNLKKLDVEFPLGKFIGVTGVSGSGKSTLVNDILVKTLSKNLYKSKAQPGKHKEIKGMENIDKIINIDQKPIGRTPRSNAATYTGVFTHIRELFASTPEARMRGYKSGRFSFNVKGGRCEACHGDGMVKIEMHFLPDIYVPCEVCKGKRYNREALEIHYKGKNITDVLDMTISEAYEFFQAIPKIKEKLATLEEVGLGYIKLGQSATTLSGGEAQRIKLATELSKRSTGKTFYVLDEPTTGLHFADVERLLNVLTKLVEKGNTVLTIEHNLDVIKTCDWLIDLGPEGGDGGGEIIATGTPEEVAKVEKSYTGKYLAKML